MIEIGMTIAAMSWVGIAVSETVHRQALLSDWRINLACEAWMRKPASYKRKSKSGQSVSRNSDQSAQRRNERVSR